jgi:hypothetical protein
MQQFHDIIQINRGTCTGIVPIFGLATITHLQKQKL